jgi:hypothetical protein
MFYQMIMSVSFCKFGTKQEIKKYRINLHEEDYTMQMIYKNKQNNIGVVDDSVEN